MEFSAGEWGIVASTETEAVVFTRPERLSNPSMTLLSSTVITGDAAGWKQGVAGPNGTLFLTQDTRQTTEGTCAGKDAMLKAIDDHDGLAAGTVSIEAGAELGDPVKVVVTIPDDRDLYETLLIAREGPTRATPSASWFVLGTGRAISKSGH
ncbi:MAG: hypothetical protein IT436_04045 [Phycisphaerales bacterium]|nr:hypothetical protein [Phycisphaerales bacterium]